MTAERGPADPPAPDGAVVEPLSRSRVELVIARSAAGFGGVFFLLSLITLIEQAPNLRPPWVVAMVAGLAAGLVLTALATYSGLRKSRAAAVFALVYAGGLVSWPLVVIDPAAAPRGSFWLYLLLTVATVMAVIAFPLRWATLYLIAAPVLYGLIRVTPQGGGVPADLAALDSIYAIVLGGFVTIVSTVLRDAARAVDEARAAALGRYAAAVRHHATDAERVEVDSLVHDSVLTTLLTAARAETPEAKALVARMAGSAIRRLREAVVLSPGEEAQLSPVALAARIRASADGMVPPVELRIGPLQDRPLPRAAALALDSAAAQAMLNSIQHAGEGARRWVELRGRAEDGGFEVEVVDTGSGFDPDAVPTERIGVRVSIVERIAAVGGRGRVVSAPGAGTRVLLSWPDPEEPADPEEQP